MSKLQNAEVDNAEIVARVMGVHVTRGALSAAFDKVANPTHWKLPIEASVVIRHDWHTDYEIALIREAVVFYTGSVPTFRKVADNLAAATYLVTAAGYYATIGA